MDSMLVRSRHFSGHGRASLLGALPGAAWALEAPLRCCTSMMLEEVCSAASMHLTSVQVVWHGNQTRQADLTQPTHKAQAASHAHPFAAAPQYSLPAQLHSSNPGVNVSLLRSGGPPEATRLAGGVACRRDPPAGESTAACPPLLAAAGDDSSHLMLLTSTAQPPLTHMCAS